MRPLVAIPIIVVALFLNSCLSDQEGATQTTETTPKSTSDTTQTIADVSTDTVPTPEVTPKPKPKPLAPPPNLTDWATSPESFDSTKWVNLAKIAPSIVIDMRYATTDNFVKEQMYLCGACYLRPKVASAIIDIHKELQGKGFGLKMFDCFRPRPIQQKLWNKVPDARYVTPPTKGSMHNKGAAVDLTIVDSLGNELDMGTPFDYFGEEAYHTYTKHSDTIAANRALLKTTMETAGFRSIRTEWWHYSFTKKHYPLSDMLWECE